MSHYKQSNAFVAFFRHIYLSYIPNKRDNLKQIIIKVLFLVCFVTLIVSSVYLANYFLEADRQNDIIDDSRTLWHEAADNNTVFAEQDPMEKIKQQMLSENSDFKGWITISGTQVDNPIYQTDNNDYYLNHNQKKQRSVYGALFFDRDDVIDEYGTDKNLVIYGHQMKNGSMFGSLKKLKSLSFYKENPTVEFSTLYKNSTYKIYAIFILNASKADDNNYIYNIYKQDFINETDFNSWRDEAYERSIINTGVDVQLGDNIITLVTCSSDFENARLVVMARETRQGESPTVDTSLAQVNPDPRYPEKWYTERGIK